MDKANTHIYRNAILRLKGKKKPDYHIAEFQKHYWNTDFSFYQDKTISSPFECLPDLQNRQKPI